MAGNGEWGTGNGGLTMQPCTDASIRSHCIPSFHHSTIPSFPPTRPIIGVTGPNDGGGAAWVFTRLAVYLAGGHAVRITPRRPRRIDHLDGLILGGGADVDPQLYGQELLPLIDEPKHARESWREYLLGLVLFPLTWLARRVAAAFFRPAQRDAARDTLELRLLDEAIARGIPVLGICRGEQLLNVFFGGTLHQDLEGFYVETARTRTLLPRKDIDVEPDTRLARVVGRHPRRVNALHRQGVDRLGHGLIVAARDRNGIIQAIEHATLPFVVGVQWHPEYLLQVPEQRELFRALVLASRARVRRSTASSAPLSPGAHTRTTSPPPSPDHACSLAADPAPSARTPASTTA